MSPTEEPPSGGVEKRQPDDASNIIVTHTVGNNVEDANLTPIPLPQEWSSARKWLIVSSISLITFMVNISLVICAPAALAIGDDLNEHSAFLLVFYITVDNLGEALAPLYVGPLSERLGRLPVIHIYNALFVVFTLVSGFANSVAQIVVFRFLAGASVASIALNSPIIGDLFTIEQRGGAISIMSLIPILGTAVGPIAGGYVTQYLNWRWTFWLTAIGTAVLAGVLLLVMRETYVPVIKRKASGQKHQSASKYIHGWNLKTVRAVTLLVVRPFRILFSSPIAVIMTLFLSLHYGYLSLVGATMAMTFQQVYGFSESSSGLIYISLTVGTLSGSIFCRFTLDHFLIHGLPFRKKPPGFMPGPPYRSENRLIPMLPAMVTFPAGLLMYGWSLEYKVHWIVPTLASALCGFSLSASTAPIMSYLVDIFGDRAASAIAAALPLRYVMGAFFPVAAPYMYESMGHGWANTFLALTLVAASPIPLLVTIHPSRLKWIDKLTARPEKMARW
ncbi:MFS multidrug transporter [Apodospora peruviana]|uniref:MFS multidrug transporter n=1 Tax=Apodospora peruviana TaxID=516989 RepID=A0AAE0LZJ8_9PEZI|nr:MFS multidrug transporter [Apodospora peruviana]